MSDQFIPKINNCELEEFFNLARTNVKYRYPKILHKKGDYFNKVLNFMMASSYMQPHLHPGAEKKERIHIILGKIAIFFFDNSGNIIFHKILEGCKNEMIEVPAFTFHTYAILSDRALTYETMDGVYAPDTWKSYASWAPSEDDINHVQYLETLKTQAVHGHE
jgi:cupin fold WbuC family metalloprotein